MKKLFIPMAIITICTFILTGQAITAVGAPKIGGIVKHVIAANPHSLGFPASQVGRDTPMASYCLESLFRTDQEGNIVPVLATGWESDPVAKTITLHLREGVKFHDGSDFNAEITKWNLDLFNSGERDELKAITLIEVVDDYTVTLHLAEYNNTIINQLTQAPGQMISKAAFEANGGEDWAVKNPVGAGPFKFVSWKNDIGIKYERFDSYWGGKPYLDGVELVYYPDGNVALIDLKAGNVQTLMMPVEAFSNLKKSGEFYFLNGVEGKPGMLVGSVQNPKSPFCDLKVRQAMSYALDSEAMADAFGLGTYIVTNQWATPGTWGYNPDIKGCPYNPEKARKLLAEAGYPRGFDTTFTFLLHRPSVMDDATAVQAYLQAVGIRVKLQPLKYASFNDVATLGKGFDGILMTMGRVFTDPLLSLSGIATGVEYNGMLKHKEFLDAYKEAMMAPDPETKKDLIWKMNYVMTDKYSMITPLWVTTSYVAIDKKLKGVEVTGESYLLFNKAWFDN